MIAPDAPERMIKITSEDAELKLFDGRMLAQNGWFVLRSVLPKGKTGKVVTWTVEPNAIENWIREPNIGFSQIGYIYERTHLRSIPELRGLAHYMPHLTIGFMLAGMTSLGLPGLIEFLPEFTIFVGTFGVYPVQALIAIFVIVFTALYVLRLLATLLFGPKDEKYASVPDEQGASMVPLIVLGAFIVGFGLFPSLLMNVINCGIEPLAPVFEQIANAPTLMGGVR